MKSKGIIGIVGGMGPEAGIDLARLVTEQTIAGCDQDHIPQVLFSLPEQINDRTEYLLKKSGPNPADSIARILITMESVGVKIAGMACNTAHAPNIFNSVEHHLAKKKSQIKLLNMVTESLILARALINAHSPEKLNRQDNYI
jgi:aspartate racemase